jgi:hypothetical protein
VWRTVDQATLKNRRNGDEYQVLVRLTEVLPAEMRVRVVADRGCGDQKLYRVLTEELKFDDVIRCPGNIQVTPGTGVPAWAWGRCMSAPRSAATGCG